MSGTLEISLRTFIPVNIALELCAHLKFSDMMTRIEHQNLNDQAYSEIRRSLAAGQFQPGQILIIRTLAEGLGISTTPLREALQRLVAERLLVMRQRSIAVPNLSADKFTEFMRIRCELEGLAVEMATPNMSAVQFQRLHQTLADLAKSVERRDSQLYTKLNQQFHFALYDAAGAPHLFQMIQDLWTQIGPYLRDILANEDFRPNANVQHEIIFEAVKNRDAARARSALAKDITDAGKLLLDKLV